MILEKPQTFSSIQHKDSDHRVSATNTNNKKGQKTGIELRYYKSSEYSNLTAAQKAELKELRAAKKGQNRGNATPSNEVAVLKQQIDALESRLIAAIATSRDTTNDQNKGPLNNPLNQRQQS